MNLLFAGPCLVGDVADTLTRDHYLGPARRGFAWQDEYGCMVLANPTSRHLPPDWLELTRWCLAGEKNGGTRQWAKVAKWLRANHKATTVVSYSDPSVGHTGALYRACNWLWAPTWQRLVPPPSQGGAWSNGKTQAVKDRWVFHLARDERRDEVLRLEETYRRRFPEAVYPHANRKLWSERCP